MRVICVTGGIGSGKSTVSRILTDYGAKILDADKMAREITERGQKALNEIIEYFGTEILTEAGELDRKKLANIVFNDENKLISLNSITHKYITEKIKENIEEAKKDGFNGIIAIDAALPFKQKFLDMVDEIWVVTADMETRIKRVMERSGLSYSDVLERVKSQKSEQEYITIADRVLINSGTFNELKQQVEKYLFQGDIIV